MTDLNSNGNGVTASTNGGGGGAMHKAAIVVRQNKTYNFHTTTLPLPRPGPMDLLVKLSCTGICGSDISLATGVLGPTLPILGHEGIGRIVAHGSAIPSSSSPPIGTRVGVAWVRSACGVCTACLYHTSGETRCLTHTVSGRAVDGTFAEYCLVPLSYVTVLPEGVADELLAPILCAGVTVYKALKICGARAGQQVVISGAGGGLGALGIQYARAMGMRVIAVDAGEEKGAFCKEMGAEVYIDVLSPLPENCASIAAAVKSHTSKSEGVPAVIVSSGSLAAYQEALDMLCVMGTLVCVGIPPPGQGVMFHPHAFIDKGLRIIGSAVGTRGDVVEACEFVGRGTVKPVVKVVKGLEEIDAVAGLYKEGKAVGKFVVRMCEDDKEGMVGEYRERIADAAIAAGKGGERVLA